MIFIFIEHYTASKALLYYFSHDFQLYFLTQNAGLSGGWTNPNIKHVVYCILLIQ